MKTINRFTGISLIVGIMLTSFALFTVPGCSVFSHPASTQPQTSADYLAEFGTDYAAVVDGLTIAHIAGVINDKQWAEVLKYEAIVDKAYAKAIAVNAAGGNILSVHSILDQVSDAMATLKAAKENPTKPIPPATQPAPGSL